MGHLNLRTLVIYSAHSRQRSAAESKSEETTSSGHEAATVLYISYTGILEPLGQSQVLRYLTRLAGSHRIALLSYEKPADTDATDRLQAIQAEIEASGIEWQPLRYHGWPTLPATLWDLARGAVVGTRTIRRKDVDLVHARSYVPALLGLVWKRVFDTAFIFDMRGFWADERVDAGVWDETDRLYRFAKWCEARFFEEADVVVSMSHAGVEAIRDLEHVDVSSTRFAVIPTCVDLDRFTPQPAPDQDGFTLGYVGSVGTWYRFDAVLDCFEYLREIRPDSRLLILNRGGHEYIQDRLAERELDPAAVTVTAVEHRAVPAAMNRIDAGVFFYTQTFSKLGTCPTKMGEFLACGIPCLSNAGVGDVPTILDGEGVGVTIESFTPAEKRRGVEQLVELSEAPDITQRCRHVAESYFALETGVAAYDELYRTVRDGSG